MTHADTQPQAQPQPQRKKASPRAMRHTSAVATQKMAGASGGRGTRGSEATDMAAAA